MVAKNSQNGFVLCVLPGQSPVNFFFSPVEAYEGAHGDFGLKEGRPLSGQTLSPVNSTSLAPSIEQFMDSIFFFSCSLVISGGNMSLLVTVTGSSTAKATEVTLADSLGQTEVNGTLQACFPVEQDFTVGPVTAR